MTPLRHRARRPARGLGGLLVIAGTDLTPTNDVLGVTMRNCSVSIWASSTGAVQNRRIVRADWASRRHGHGSPRHRPVPDR